MAAPLSLVEARDVDPRGVDDRRADRPKGAPDRATSVRPSLVVIPGRRRATRYVVSIMTVISASMAGVILVNTQLAQRQIAIDEIQSQLASEEARFDELRAERAELRAPQRLEPLARQMGMGPTEESEFSAVDPWVYAQQIALVGAVPGSTDDGGVTVAADPMDQYRSVKVILEANP